MAGGTPLIGTGTDLGGRANELRTLLTLLALVAVMLVFAGCAAGSEGSSQASGQEEQQGAKGEDSGGGQASKEQLGHPALGSADAPVVMIEYSDYQ
ncbi:MAG TPA: hypothetical protein VGP38_07640 [Rubrobacter sp.]|nr:hypothetical protein [Rubrobacter sp.]